MITVEAHYAGVCPECGERWKPGDLICAGQTPGVAARWQHASCPPPTHALALKPGESVCTTCWLVHPEGECDR